MIVGSIFQVVVQNLPAVEYNRLILFMVTLNIVPFKGFDLKIMLNLFSLKVYLNQLNQLECSNLYTPNNNFIHGYDHNIQMCYGATNETDDTCKVISWLLNYRYVNIASLL